MKNKRTKSLFRLSIVMAAVLSLCTLQLGAQARYGQQNDGGVVNLNAGKLVQTYYILNNYYLDTLNFPAITDKLLSTLVKELDPHSDYIPAKDVEAMNEPLEGNFSGVGIEFAIMDDTLTVQATIQGGPAESVGVKAGDKIVKVDSESISNTKLTIERVHKYLRGPEGSIVTIEVLRREESHPLQFVIKRGKIPVNSMDSAYEYADGILYIKLSRFSATSYKELMQAVREHPHQNGIILDLRNNGGGLLLSALQIANEFLHQGQLILYTEGRTSRREAQRANGYGYLQDVPLVILINENSASSSEIVAGAMQDWDRATLIGRRSFGKGLVQQQLPLKDGSMLRVTVARYHTPSGRVIQRPYKKGETLQYYKDFAGRYGNGGGVFSADTLHLPDSLKFKTIVKGRTVYGGGGIMPDLFVPSDTSFYTKFYGEIVRKGLLTDFVNKYIDSNRERLKSKYIKEPQVSTTTLASKDYQNFVKNFEVSQELFDQFLAYAAEKGVTPKEGDLEVSGEELKFYLKAMVLRHLTNTETYVRFVNERDEEVEMALKLLRSPEVPQYGGHTMRQTALE